MTGKVISFLYTKEDGSSSKRTIYSLSSPSNKYFGIDISERSFEDQNDFIADMQRLEEAHKMAVSELMAKHDLRHRYRYFLESGISNLEVE